MAIGMFYSSSLTIPTHYTLENRKLEDRLRVYLTNIDTYHMTRNTTKQVYVRHCSAFFGLIIISSIGKIQLLGAYLVLLGHSQCGSSNIINYVRSKKASEFLGTSNFDLFWPSSRKKQPINGLFN